MIKKALVFAVTAACLTSGAAFAQSAGYSNDYSERSNRYERQDRYDRDVRDSRDYRRDGYRSNAGRDDRNSRYERDDRNSRYDRDDRYQRRDYGYAGQRDQRYGDHRGYVRHDGYRGNGHAYGHRNHWRHGARISQDHGRYVVVNDWQRHQRLYAPQRGHHWVQTGNDYALVAIATGIIASVLLSN